MEGTLEPCHLHLLLSTYRRNYPVAPVVVAVNITKKTTLFLDMLITLGEGDKALMCLR